MSEVKRYTAWASEVALPRGTMVVLAADYDSALAARDARIAELEGLLRKCRIYLGGLIGLEIDGALAGQPARQVECVACEDQPIAGNNPCSVCGKNSRQVGVDEREAFEEWYIRESCKYVENLEAHAAYIWTISKDVMRVGWQARAALAPAAAVMPKRMTTIPEGKTISYAAGYEDALDAVANLNRNTVPLELLAIIHEGLDDYWITTAEGARALDQLRAILGVKP